MPKFNEKPPKTYQKFLDDFPDVAEALELLGERANNVGPLDAKTVRLIKLAMSLSAFLEGAVHADVRKALAVGISPKEIRQVAILSITTNGLPTAMAGLKWIDKALAENS